MKHRHQAHVMQTALKYLSEQAWDAKTFDSRGGKIGKVFFCIGTLFKGEFHLRKYCKEGCVSQRL